MTFEDLNLPKEILKAIEDMGFTKPTEIQKNAIPFILEGRDIIGKSRTGTGKTAAFSIPLIMNIDNNIHKNVNTLILCPTRELALQVCDEIKKYSKYKPGVRIVPVFGGQSYTTQISSLKKDCNIVVGTPGRIIDHIKRGNLNLKNVKSIVLDEADEMLNMGFINDIEEIFSKLTREDLQVILFSATMPKDIVRITKKYQKDPVLVDIKNKTVKSLVEQYYCCIKNIDKLNALRVILKYKNPSLAIIFCNTKRMVDELELKLNSFGLHALGLHGDMKQSSRTAVMNKFKGRKINILIATDVAARGIDVSGVDIVINYDLPQDTEYYVHRVGRTGRAGKNGISYTLISDAMQYRELQKIKKVTNFEISNFTLPNKDEMRNLQVKKSFESLKLKLNNDSNISKDTLEVYNLLIEEGFSEEQICKALINTFFVKKVSDIPNVECIDESYFSSRNNSQYKNRNEKYKKLVLNGGRKDGFSQKNLLREICSKTGIRSKSVGKIVIYNEKTSIEILESIYNMVERKLKKFNMIELINKTFTKNIEGSYLLKNKKPK